MHFLPIAIRQRAWDVPTFQQRRLVDPSGMSVLSRSRQHRVVCFLDEVAGAPAVGQRASCPPWRLRVRPGFDDVSGTGSAKLVSTSRQNNAGSCRPFKVTATARLTRLTKFPFNLVVKDR